MPRWQSALLFFDRGLKRDKFPDKTESKFSACADRPSCMRATFPEMLNYPPCLLPKSFRRSFRPWEWYVLGCYAVKNVPFRVLSEQQLDFGFAIVEFTGDILELPLGDANSGF